MIVPIRLRLNTFDCTITTGLVYPGWEAVGSGKSTHQISPRFTIARCLRILLGAPVWQDQPSRESLRRPCREQPEPAHHRSFPDSYEELGYRVGFETYLNDGLAFQLIQIPDPGWRWLFSYSKYNSGYTLSLIHISEPTRRTPISYAVFCLKK